METRKDMLNWIKEHKKEMAIAGVGTIALILMVKGMNKSDKIKILWVELEKLFKQPATKLPDPMDIDVVSRSLEPISASVPPIAPNLKIQQFKVNRHIRNLPTGWHASQEKISNARKFGVFLKDGQTWVESYMKGNVAA